MSVNLQGMGEGADKEAKKRELKNKNTNTVSSKKSLKNLLLAVGNGGETGRRRDHVMMSVSVHHLMVVHGGVARSGGGLRRLSELTARSALAETSPALSLLMFREIRCKAYVHVGQKSLKSLH